MRIHSAPGRTRNQFFFGRRPSAHGTQRFPKTRPPSAVILKNDRVNKTRIYNIYFILYLSIMLRGCVVCAGGVEWNTRVEILLLSLLLYL